MSTAKNKKQRMEPSLGKRTITPHFTGSLDAKIPLENIIFSQFQKETGRWLAISESENGFLFFGDGATEPLARRVAGLEMLAYYQGIGKEVSKSDLVRSIQIKELSDCLDRLINSVEGNNEDFQGMSRNFTVIRLKHTKDALTEEARNRTFLATCALPILYFLSKAFIEGIIGKYAERCLEFVEKLIRS